jgi:parallel beta-helix repeat protein
MAITHSTVMATGQRGYAADWNAEHVVDDDSKPKNLTTLIVAASNSLDTTRADYVCDGVDDEEEINAALAALPAGGGRVSLLEGTYQLGAAIDITSDGVTLVGLGYSTVVQITANDRVIEVKEADYCLIDSLRIVGAGAGNGNNYGVYLNGSSYCIVRGCWIEDCGNMGIQIVALGATPAENNIIQGNIVLRSDNVGINTTEEGTIITGNVSNENANYGIHVHIAGDCVIDGNVVRENEKHGIAVTDSNDCIVSNNLVIDNDFSDTASFDGIYLDTADYNIIEGNRCRDNDRDEIRINNAASDDNLVHGNICKGVDHVAAIVDNGTNTVSADNIV